MSAALGSVADGGCVSRRGFVACMVAASGLAALSLAGLSGCGDSAAASPKTVAYCLEGAPDVYSVGAYVARARASLARSGLELEIVEPDEGMTALDMVNAGKAQFGLSSQETLARAFAVDEPASVVAVAVIAQHDITRRAKPAVPRTAACAGRDSYSTLVIANDAYLVNSPEESRAVVGALGRGYSYAASNPKGAARVFQEQTGDASKVSRARLERDLELLASQLLDAKGRWGSISQKRWDGFFSWLSETGRIDRVIPAHHGYTLDYLRDFRRKEG